MRLWSLLLGAFVSSCADPAMETTASTSGDNPRQTSDAPQARAKVERSTPGNKMRRVQLGSEALHYTSLVRERDGSLRIACQKGKEALRFDETSPSGTESLPVHPPGSK